MDLTALHFHIETLLSEKCRGRLRCDLSTSAEFPALLSDKVEPGTLFLGQLWGQMAQFQRGFAVSTQIKAQIASVFVQLCREKEQIDSDLA